MKKIVSLVLALSMVLSMFATVFAATLSDIGGTKYEGAVEALVELGVVNGYPTGDYKPENEVNRAELAKMIVICMGLEEDADRAQYQTSFADDSLTENGNFAWARGYVNAAAAAGVIKGYPDGTFGPERTVTYAEAVTMMLRALGYGNVMEAEGTWPTNAMMKAKELEMFEDVEFNSSNDGATRGDVAILLWNMLRTPMWKITSENQGTGMTSEMDKLMLNVKFPKYAYVEDYRLAYVTVDDGEVQAAVGTWDEEEEEYDIAFEGTLTSGDLVRMIPGMKVSALYNKKTEEFLTINCEETLAEGYLTIDGTKCEIGDAKYSIPNGEGYEDYDEYLAGFEGKYVLAVINGKKVIYVEEMLTGATVIEEGKLDSTVRKLDEDSIVIIDGVWATVEDLEEGDAYTKLDGFYTYEDKDLDGVIYVARERVEGSYDGYIAERDEDDGDIYQIEVDGEKYDFSGELVVKEADEKGKYAELSDADLTEFKSDDEDDNKYLGEDCEVVLDYLGLIVEVRFDYISPLEGENNFMVVTSDGAWHESSREGMTYYMALAGAEGDDTYEVKKNIGTDETTYAFPTDEADIEAGPIFYYVEKNNDGVIKTLTALADGLELPLDAEDDEDVEYEIHLATATELDDDNYLGDYKVTASTIVYTAKFVTEENENDVKEVVGVELDVTEGTEALDGKLEGDIYVAVEPGKTKAAFVFVTSDPESTELKFGKVKDTAKSGKYVYIDGKKLEVAEHAEEIDIDDTLVGRVVAYTETEDGINIKLAVGTGDLEEGMFGLVTIGKDDELVKVDAIIAEIVNALAEDTIAEADKELDITKKDVVEAFEDITFVIGNVDVEKDGTITFDSKLETVKGLEVGMLEDGDRLVCAFDGTEIGENVIAVIRGLDAEDVVVDGAIAE